MSKLGLRGASRVGEAGMGLRVWRVGRERLSMCLGWGRQLRLRVGEVRRLEVGLRMGVRRGARVGVHGWGQRQWG